MVLLPFTFFFLGGGVVHVYATFQCFLDRKVFWFSQALGLSLLPLDFSFILPIVSRLLQLCSTDNKDSTLMVKRFSTVRDTWRGSPSYMKNRRGMKEIEVSRQRERGTQEERDRSTQLSVPEVFSVAQTPSKIHRIGLGREGERRK